MGGDRAGWGRQMGLKVGRSKRGNGWGEIVGGGRVRIVNGGWGGYRKRGDGETCGGVAREGSRAWGWGGSRGGGGCGGDVWGEGEIGGSGKMVGDRCCSLSKKGEGGKDPKGRNGMLETPSTIPNHANLAVQRISSSYIHKVAGKKGIVTEDVGKTPDLFSLSPDSR